MLACDGSDLNIARNPNDKDTYFQSNPADKGYNLLHLNALFDLCSKRHVDALIQPARRKNEYSAMTQMIDRYAGEKKTVFIADRGYAANNIFAHVQEKGMYYLIRVKDGSGGGMAGSLRLPGKEEFDHPVPLIFTRKKTREVKAHPELYKILEKTSPFDYVNLGGIASFIPWASGLYGLPLRRIPMSVSLQICQKKSSQWKKSKSFMQ